MSRQSKNARKKAAAKKFTELRKSGGNGPKATHKVTTKSNVWWKKKPGADRTNTARGSN